MLFCFTRAPSLVAAFGLGGALFFGVACSSLPERETGAKAVVGDQAETEFSTIIPPDEGRFVKLTPMISSTGASYPMYRTRSAGKPVLLLHPLNSLSPQFLYFALEMEKWGYRVYFPSLFGEKVLGRPAYGFNGGGVALIGRLKRDERWEPAANDTLGPIVEEVAEMTRWVSRCERGRSIAVVGNSLSGMIPLAVLSEPSVRVAVLGQPATPVLRVHEILGRQPQPRAKKRALSISDEDWRLIVRAMRRDRRKRIYGFLYVDDPLASIERFSALNGRLAKVGMTNRFRAYVLESPGDTFVHRNRSWVVGEKTDEKRKILTPHSTYGAAQDEEDRAWYRRQLRRALGGVSF